MIKHTGIEGLYLIEPKVFEDERGYFMESFNQRFFQNNNINYNWVQDNESESSYGVLRGMHYQTGSHAQAKLIRVVQGEVLDVVIDVRPDSKSYGQVFSEIISDQNKRQMLIPEGMAHGFIVLSESARFLYKCNQYYQPESEGSIHPFDPDLDIDWILPKKKIKLSDKDDGSPFFGHHRSFQ